MAYHPPKRDELLSEGRLLLRQLAISASTATIVYVLLQVLIGIGNV